MAKKWQPYAIPFSYTHDEVGETQPSVLGMDSEVLEKYLAATGPAPNQPRDHHLLSRTIIASAA